MILLCGGYICWKINPSPFCAGLDSARQYIEAALTEVSRNLLEIAVPVAMYGEDV